MNRFLRLTPRNQSLLQSLTTDERRAAWNTVNLLVRNIKNRSDGAQMSDNSAIELLCQIGLFGMARANPRIKAGLALAKTHKVRLDDME